MVRPDCAGVGPLLRSDRLRSHKAVRRSPRGGHDRAARGPRVPDRRRAVAAQRRLGDRRLGSPGRSAGLGRVPAGPVADAGIRAGSPGPGGGAPFPVRSLAGPGGFQTGPQRAVPRIPGGNRRLLRRRIPTLAEPQPGRGVGTARRPGAIRDCQPAYIGAVEHGK